MSPDPAPPRPADWTLAAFDPASAALADDWNALLAQSDGTPVQRAELLFAAARHYAAGELRVAVMRRDGRIRAMALLGGHRLAPEVFVAAQTPLGAWVQAPGEDFSGLARTLLARLPLALRLGVPQLDPRHAPPPSPTDGLASVALLPYIRTPWLAIEGDFPTYWAARGRNLRANLRKQRERLAARGESLRIEILREAADMARAVADYAGLEARGWKSGEGTALVPGGEQARFYTDALERLAAAGVAEVWCGRIGERLVACELCLRERGEFAILKTTYDETMAPLSPAALMRLEMFERLHGDGDVRRIEFYGPLKEWHTRWSHETRDVYHANVHAGRAVAAAFAALRTLRARGAGRAAARA
jgi:CelD/BcsL family acetyltransferase involved in cellulose biosynthesis